MSKTAFITGGSRGIGSTCVKKFIEEGWNVAFTYNKSKEEAEKMAEAFNSYASTEGTSTSIGRAFTIHMDLGDPEEIDLAIFTSKEHFGIDSFDALIANAGISRSGVLSMMSHEDIDELLNVNLKGQILTCRAVYDDMVSKKSGSIILISSIWGIRGASTESVYSASKGGLIAFAKSLAKELGPSGIRVNAIAPGVIDTDMNAIYTEEEKESLKEATSLGTLGTSEDVANAAYFLCDDKAGFITGQVLGIDGGIII